ncbi:folylpolyglutamate synthase [Diutina catenulata]
MATAADTEHRNMKAVRTYKDAVAALNTLQSNFASIEATRKLGASVDRNQLSISEVYECTRRLGYHPSDFNKLNIIHVTGTKGKGSTCAFTESICRQYLAPAGPLNKIGLFTSPHLKSVRERIRINGAPIAEPKFAKYFFEVWDKLSETESDPEKFPTLQPSSEVKPMYFKYLTLLSFHVFMREGVDTAIYEVGVGGQYDSTNIIDQPTATGITALGIDHTFMLGDTIDKIAWNKTGIFKRGCPAFVAQQLDYPESMQVVEERAQEKQVSELVVVNADDTLAEDQKLGLPGDFQRQNAALAVRLADAHLRKLGVPDLVSYSDDSSVDSLPSQFVDGLAQAEWPGRCQKISDAPGYEHINWYIDGAHTLESIAKSSEWFGEEMAKSKKKNLKVLLFNQQSRENAEALLEKLYDTVVPGVVFDHVIFTTNVTWSSGRYNADLVSMNTSKQQVDEMVIQKSLATTWAKKDAANGHNSRKHIFPDIETGVNFIKSLTSSPDYAPAAFGGVDVFVCGSLHLVGGFLVVLDGDHQEE